MTIRLEKKEEEKDHRSVFTHKKFRTIRFSNYINLFFIAIDSNRKKGNKIQKIKKHMIAESRTIRCLI